MKRIALIISVIIVVLFAGCQKQLQIEKDINSYNFDYSKYFEIENSTIKFKDSKSFQEVVNKLNKDKNINISNWLKYIGFDNSMYLAVNDSTKTTLTNIEDPVIRAIVNKKGYFVIGNEIYMILKDTVYTIVDGKFETIEKIENGDYCNLKNVTKFYSVNKIGNSKTFSGQSEFYMYLKINSNGSYSFIKSFNNDLYNSDNKVNDRIRISAWSRNFGLYSSNGIQEEYQYKKKSIWGISWTADNKIDHGIINATTEGRYCSVLTPWLPFNIFGSDEEYLVTRVDKTLFYQAAKGSTIETNYINANYQFNIYKNVSGETKYFWGSTSCIWQ